MGAYWATLVRYIEAETVVLLLDLYLNYRVANFEARLERLGIGTLMRSVCANIAV